MRKNYKLPKHIKYYVVNELYSFKENKKKLRELQEDIIYSSSYSDGLPKSNTISDTTSQKALKLTSSRTIILLTDKVNKISKVLSSLDKLDYEVIDIIFFKGHSQIYAQMHDNISKDTYYNTMNKVIYMVANELDLI